MKKIISSIFILLSFAALFAKEISVKVSPGQHWKEKREPQVAIWLEDGDGNYIRTLYVTERASHKSWIFGPKEGRPESLPVWYGANASEEVATTNVAGSPDSKLDAVTSATPKSALNLTAQLDDKDYVIKAEFNNSFDYNDFYTKKTSGVNGQPSVVYCSKIPAEAAADKEITLEFEGCGSLAGEDGKINKNTENLTTAKNIVSAVTVKLN